MGASSELPKPRRYDGLVLAPPQLPDVVQGELRALNEELSRDVLPEENAAVLLVYAIGESIWNEDLRPTYRQMLGIAELPDQRRLLCSVEAYADQLEREQRSLPAERRALLVSLGKTILLAPWTGDQYPELVAYLDYLEEPLDAVVDASGRPKLYVPWLSTSQPLSIVNGNLKLEQQSMQAIRSLLARAMLRAGHGENDEAIADLLAVRRLARLFGQGPALINYIVGNAADGHAFQAEKSLLESRSLSADQLERYRHQVRSLASFPSPAHCFDQVERAVLRQGIRAMQRGEWFHLDLSADSSDPKKEFFVSLFANPRVDWAAVLDSAETQLRAAQAVVLESDPDKQVALDKALEDEISEWKRESPAQIARLPDSLLKDPRTASRVLGKSIAILTLPSFTGARKAHGRQQAKELLRELGPAVLLYRDRTGRFPEDLSLLVPEFIDRVPVDPFTGRRLTYFQGPGDSCRMYSWGENRQDNQGQPLNQDQSTDDWDLVIRSLEDVQHSPSR